MKRKKIINEIIIIVLITAYVYPGVDKLTSRKKFNAQLDFSPLIPQWSTPILSWLVPLTLIAIAGLLCIKPLREKALLLYTAVIGFFTIYIIGILTVAKYKPCTCIGFSEGTSWEWQLIMNTVLLLLATLLLKRERKHSTDQNMRLLQGSVGS